MSEYITVGQVCNITTGKLDSNHFEENGKFPFFTCAPTPLKINTYAFDDEVILIAGNNASGNFHINKYNGKFNAYQRTYVLTEKEGYDLNYIFYSLKIELKYLKEKSQGSQTKFLTMPLLTSIKLKNRNLVYQQKIAAVLSALDSKIELNNLTNKELESMAKTLYDYWFVQFDFPDANGKPYRSSGGRMVYNPQLKREIPEGWEVDSLGNCITIERGISYKSNEIGSFDGTPMINLNSFYLDGNYKVDGLKYFTGKYNKTVEPFDLVVATTDVTRNADIIGKAFTVPDIFNDDIVLSCDIAKISVSDRLDKYYLEMLFNSNYYHKYIKGFASGTLVLHLNTDGINWYKTIIPPKKLLEKYSVYKESIEKKKSEIILENQQLASLRDWLLPMLINGQVGFKENGKHAELTVKKCTPSESAVLAARIIAKNQNKDFGRVKLMKNLFQTGYSFDLDLGYPLYRHTAGPHNEDLIKEIEGTLKRYKIYETSTRTTKNNRDLVVYSPMENVNQADVLFEECFADHAKEIDTFLDKLSKLSWEKSEIVATLYAVWNNHLIKKEPVDIDSLIEGFYAWSDHKKDYSRERIISAYEYMKAENIVPTGRGKYIDEKHKEK